MKIPYFRIGSPTICTYCGDAGDAYDHVICVASQTINRKKSDRTEYGPIARSCSSCNGMLGSKYFNSFMERCSFVSHRINLRAKPVLWTRREMSELDWKLLKLVEQDVARRLWYRSRSDWFQSRDFWLNLESINWEQCLDSSHPKFNEQLFLFFKSTMNEIKSQRLEKSK